MSLRQASLALGAWRDTREGEAALHAVAIGKMLFGDAKGEAEAVPERIDMGPIRARSPHWFEAEA